MAEFKRRTPGEKKFSRGGGDRRGPRSGGRPSKFSDRNRPEMTTVTCDSCKQKCEVPFKPSSNKPVYCSDCFKKDSKPNGRDRSNNREKPNGSLSEINKKLDKIMKALEIE
jgi:CxxC-x17-CxxC domain-containing protein